MRLVLDEESALLSLLLATAVIMVFVVIFLRVIFLYTYLQWEREVEKREEDFGKISKLIQKEMVRFEVRSVYCTEQKTSKQKSLQ